MKNCTTLLHKPVLSLYDGAVLGTTAGLAFSKKLQKIDYVLFEKDVPVHTAYALKPKDIFSETEDAIVIKYSELAVPLFSVPGRPADNAPLDAPVYTVHGKLLGSVQAVETDEKYRTARVTLNSGEELGLSRVAVSTRDAVFVQDAERPVSLPPPRSRKVPAKLPPKAANAEAQQKPALPARASVNFEFLIGRRTVRDVTNSAGKVIIKRGTLITLPVLETARSYARLVELTRYSQIQPGINP